ncbi:hypothetical protein EDY46_20420, partial [Salmonella enterica]|nr:hypothetical protein [Salmonella enterica]
VVTMLSWVIYCVLYLLPFLVVSHIASKVKIYGCKKIFFINDILLPIIFIADTFSNVRTDIQLVLHNKIHRDYP